MEQRNFGDTGLAVSVVGLGAGHIGQLADSSEADELLGYALDSGVTFIDTARGYGDSELIIGRSIARRRDEFVLSTKVGYSVPGVEDWTYDAVAQGVDRALAMLQTDYLDVVFLHSCPLETLLRGEVIEALHAARDAGKVRVAGYSGENEELRWAVESGHFAGVQTSVNLADQWSLRNVLADAAARGIGVVAKRPLANVAWTFAERPVGAYAETYWERLQTLALAPADLDWQGTALRFAAFAPGVSTAIVGTKSQVNLGAAIAAAGKGPLPADEFQRWLDAAAAHADWTGQV